MGARTTPITYGWMNAFKTSVGISFQRFLSASFIGEIPNMLFYTSLGSALTDITAMLDPEAEDGMSTEKLVMLIVQVVACSLFLLSGILWGSKIIREAVEKEKKRAQLEGEQSD